MFYGAFNANSRKRHHTPAEAVRTKLHGVCGRIRARSRLRVRHQDGLCILYAARPRGPCVPGRGRSHTGAPRPVPFPWTAMPKTCSKSYPEMRPDTNPKTWPKTFPTPAPTHAPRPARYWGRSWGRSWGMSWGRSWARQVRVETCGSPAEYGAPVAPVNVA